MYPLESPAFSPGDQESHSFTGRSLRKIRVKGPMEEATIEDQVPSQPAKATESDQWFRDG